MAASDAAAAPAYWVANSALGIAVRLYFHRVGSKLQRRCGRACIERPSAS
jgi:hypothetical protein